MLGTGPDHHRNVGGGGFFLRSAHLKVNPIPETTMIARSSTVGLLALLALSLLADTAPYFTLESTGALRMQVTGGEARLGLLREPVNGRPVMEISLGATTGEAALLLFTYADQPLVPGRYPVGPELPADPAPGRRFHPCFIAGTAERPAGFFHGEVGWVTITAVEGGRVAGEYEMEARGFLASDMDDENRLVTIRGTFRAVGDDSIAALHAVAAAPR